MATQSFTSLQLTLALSVDRYVIGFLKTVSNHTFLFSYVYHCHTNDISLYYMEFNAQITKLVKEILMHK